MKEGISQGNTERRKVNICLLHLLFNNSCPSLRLWHQGVYVEQISSLIILFRHGGICEFNPRLAACFKCRDFGDMKHFLSNIILTDFRHHNSVIA